VAEHCVSVRELAEFCYRSGDIDHRFTPSPTGVQGTEGHQRVFRSRPQSYCSEYAAEYLHESNGLQLLLRGRADGFDPAIGMVEEIKTCRVNPDTIASPVKEVHLAQARLYAALIARQEGRDELEVRLTWFNIDTEQESTSKYSYSAEELAAFLGDSLCLYSNWLEQIYSLKAVRNKSIASFEFPYPDFRTGQREIAELVYKCVDQNGQLLLEAPTGIGKTSAVLYPALKAMAQEKHDGVLFLTAKSVGRRAVEQTLAHFRQSGFCGVALSMTAKEKICLSPGKACHSDDCPYASGYYDKLARAREAAVHATTLTRIEIEALARQFELCPYQLMLDLLPWVDIIVADLHYFYSLTPTFSTLMEERDQRWTALVDEAHNMPSRARKMYSAGLTKAGLMFAKSRLDKKSSKAIARSMEKINREMLALQKGSWAEPEFDSRSELPQSLCEALVRFVAEVSEKMAEEPAYLHKLPELKAFFFDGLQFLRVAENWGEEYRFECSRLPDTRPGSWVKQSLCLDLNCLDPARLLAQRHQPLHSLTVFSATLSPVHWMHGSLGLRKNCVNRRLSSPFKPEQMQVSIATDIDTRYRARSASLAALAELLQQWILRENDNCIVYFSSYRYLADCVELMQARGLDAWGRKVWRQSSQQSESVRSELLGLFESHRNVLAFCILGGVFGEGIDLPGDRLRAVAVVGVGLPQVNRDTQQLQAYFEARFGQGFHYAYLYPGMQKVDQALGRVVRRDQDRGRALLVDKRYGESEYRALLPPGWSYQGFNEC